MNHKRLKVLARLLKEGHIDEDEFILLSEKEVELRYFPSPYLYNPPIEPYRPVWGGTTTTDSYMHIYI